MCGKEQLGRREFLLAAAAGTSSVIGPRTAFGVQPRPEAYRAAVIGHTGRGDYGHGMDRVWADVPGTKVVAVADANERGLAGAVKRLAAAKGFADYRRMLDATKPDLVSIIDH